MKILTTIYLCFLFVSCNKLVYSNEYAELDVFESKMNSSINLNNIDVSLIEQSVIYLSNVYRKQKGKKKLLYNKNLKQAALTHSSQMVKHDFFNHINKYEKHFKDLDDRANYVGYINFETLSENIFHGYIDIENIGTYKDLALFIVNSFIESKGHEENLLANDINEIGCGIAFEKYLKDGYWYFYFTQDFGKRF